MKNIRTKVLTLLLVGTIVPSVFALGDSRLRVKLDMKQMAPSKKVAIVAFTGNSVITGNMGLGSLVTGALAKKKDGESKAALDNAYMGTIYDMFTNTLKNEGYTFLPVDSIVNANAYKEATAVAMPSFVDAKGLKQMNVDKADALKKLAAETGADLFFHVTSGHSLGMRANFGVIVGKQVGIATALVVVYDANGKKLGFIDASDISDQSVGAVAGGLSDPNKIMPLLENADQRMISKLAAKVSLKK